MKLATLLFPLLTPPCTDPGPSPLSRRPAPVPTYPETHHRQRSRASEYKDEFENRSRGQPCHQIFRHFRFFSNEDVALRPSTWYCALPVQVDERNAIWKSGLRNICVVQTIFAAIMEPIPKDYHCQCRESRSKLWPQLCPVEASKARRELANCTALSHPSLVESDITYLVNLRN